MLSAKEAAKKAGIDKRASRNVFESGNRPGTFDLC